MVVVLDRIEEAVIAVEVAMTETEEEEGVTVVVVETDMAGESVVRMVAIAETVEMAKVVDTETEERVVVVVVSKNAVETVLLQHTGIKLLLKVASLFGIIKTGKNSSIFSLHK